MTFAFLAWRLRDSEKIDSTGARSQGVSRASDTSSNTNTTSSEGDKTRGRCPS